MGGRFNRLPRAVWWLAAAFVEEVAVPKKNSRIPKSSFGEHPKAPPIGRQDGRDDYDTASEELLRLMRDIAQESASRPTLTADSQPTSVCTDDGGGMRGTLHMLLREAPYIHPCSPTIH